MSAKCGLCHKGEEAAECGTLHTGEVGGKPVAAHHKCMQYSAGLRQYKSDKFGGFKVDKVKKEINRAGRLPCSLCRKKGASGGCAWASCRKGYHYPCAFNNPATVTKRYKVESNDLRVIMYRVFCSKQHETVYRQNIKSGKSGLGEQQYVKTEPNNSNKTLKQTSGDEKTDKDEDHSDAGQGHSESDTDDYDPKEKQGSDEHSMSMRSVDGNETVSSTHETSGLTEKEIIEETKKEFLKLKEKRKAEDFNSTKEKRLRSSDNKNNNRSESPSLLAPPAMKTRSSPVVNSSRLPTSQLNGFDLSHSLSPEASEKSDDETMDEDDDTEANMNTEEVVLLIPSLLGVPDSELEGIYKELEIAPDQSVVWPPSNRVGSLQDKHLPLLMWNLVEAFRTDDFSKVSTILRNPSGREYDCFVNFHTKQNDTQNDSVVKEVFHNIADKLFALNGKLSGTGKCGQLMSRKYQMMKVLVLYLSSKSHNHRKVITCLHHSSLFQWSRDTAMRNMADKPQKSQQEFSLLWKWMKNRVKSGFQIDSCPVEEVFINEKYSTEVVGKLVDKLTIHPQCTSFSSNTSTAVLAINSANRDVVRYDCFVRRAVERLVETTMCRNIYFIISLHKGDNISSVRDLLPLHLMDDADVYTAFDPEETRVSCILLYVKKEEGSTAETVSRSSPVVQRRTLRGKMASSSGGTPIVVMSPLNSSQYQK